jgi:hypothetical protein
LEQTIGTHPEPLALAVEESTSPLDPETQREIQVVLSPCCPRQEAGIALLSKILTGLDVSSRDVDRKKIEILIRMYVTLEDSSIRPEVAAVILNMLSTREKQCVSDYFQVTN